MRGVDDTLHVQTANGSGFLNLDTPCTSIQQEVERDTPCTTKLQGLLMETPCTSTLQGLWIDTLNVHTAGYWMGYALQVYSDGGGKKCLQHRAWAAPLHLYGQQEQVLLLEVPTLLRPELHMDVSTPQGPELHLDVCKLQRAWSIWMCLRHRVLCCSRTYLNYRGLWCTLTCLHCRGLCCSLSCQRRSTGAWAAPGRGRLLLLLRFLHHRDLSCRRTCVHWRDVCCSWRCLHYNTGAWAAPGRVWTSVSPVLLLD